MGAYWLHNLPSEAAKRGLQIETYPGWELRSRSSGGLDGIWGVCMHHTASATRPENDMAYQWVNSVIRPIGNISLHRDGTIVLGAAGAANTQGAGGPLPTSRGVVPRDEGNKYYIAIEACNNGIGEVWPAAQVAAYKRLVEVLCDVYTLKPETDVILHATWAPTRKIDPAGPTPSLPAWGGVWGAKTWGIDDVRDSLVQSGVEMSSFKIFDPIRIVDTRVGTPYNKTITQLTPGGWMDAFPVGGQTPDDADGVILSITGLAHAGTGGFLTLWSGEGSKPDASNANPVPGVPSVNMVWVPLKVANTFRIGAGGPAGVKLGVVIDQVGWYKL